MKTLLTVIAVVGMVLGMVSTASASPATPAQKDAYSYFEEYSIGRCVLTVHLTGKVSVEGCTDIDDAVRIAREVKVGKVAYIFKPLDRNHVGYKYGLYVYCKSSYKGTASDKASCGFSYSLGNLK